MMILVAAQSGFQFVEPMLELGELSPRVVGNEGRGRVHGLGDCFAIEIRDLLPAQDPLALAV